MMHIYFNPIMMTTSNNDKGDNNVNNVNPNANKGFKYKNRTIVTFLSTLVATLRAYTPPRASQNSITPTHVRSKNKLSVLKAMLIRRHFLSRGDYSYHNVCTELSNS